MDNKGISPLISIILMVGLTVSIVAVVITYGVDTFKEVSENSEKTIEESKIDSVIKVKLDSAVVSFGETNEAQTSKSSATNQGYAQASAPETSGTEKQVTFSVTSLTNVKIEGFSVEVHYLDGSVSLVGEVIEELKSFGSQSYSFSYMEEGEVDYFDIKPIVNGRIIGNMVEFTPIEV